MITEWDPPKSLAEARQRRRVCIAEIEEIQVQLGNKMHEGRPHPHAENYWSWRQSAQWALVNKQQELRLIKEWIYDYWNSDDEANSA